MQSRKIIRPLYNNIIQYMRHHVVLLCVVFTAVQLWCDLIGSRRFRTYVRGPRGLTRANRDRTEAKNMSRFVP